MMKGKRKTLKLLILVMAIIFAIGIGLFIPLLTHASGKVFDWSKEGTSPFWKKPIKSEEDLKAAFQDGNFLAKLTKRLPSVEPGWDAKEVVRLAGIAVLNGQAQKITIEPGSAEAKFEWMLAGENWKSESDATVVWNGDHPLNAFLVPIVYEGEDVNLFFGNFCVNVLKGKKKAEVPPGEYKTERPTRPPKRKFTAEDYQRRDELVAEREREIRESRPREEDYGYYPPREYQSPQIYVDISPPFPLPPPPFFWGYQRHDRYYGHRYGRHYGYHHYDYHGRPHGPRPPRVRER